MAEKLIKLFGMYTSKCWINFPNFYGTLARKLAQKHFQIVHRLSDDK